MRALRWCMSNRLNGNKFFRTPQIYQIPSAQFRKYFASDLSDRHAKLKTIYLHKDQCVSVFVTNCKLTHVVSVLYYKTKIKIVNVEVLSCSFGHLDTFSIESNLVMKRCERAH